MKKNRAINFHFCSFLSDHADLIPLTNTGIPAVKKKVCHSPHSPPNLVRYVAHFGFSRRSCRYSIWKSAATDKLEIGSNGQAGQQSTVLALFQAEVNTNSQCLTLAFCRFATHFVKQGIGVKIRLQKFHLPPDSALSKRMLLTFPKRAGAEYQYWYHEDR